MPNSFIRKLRLAGHLSDDDEACLAALCTDIRFYKRNQRIFTAGAEVEHMFVLLDGWARRSRSLRTGERQIFSYLLPGDVTDIYPAVLGTVDHEISAITDLHVVVIEASRLLEVFEQHPRIRHALVWSMLVEKSILREWLLRNGRQEAHSRLAHLFFELYTRMSLVGLVDHDTFAMPLTQQQIAECTGLTSVHINRVVRRLRAEKLIVSHKQMMTILDPKRMAEVAGFDDRYLHAPTGGRHPDSLVPG